MSARVEAIKCSEKQCEAAATGPTSVFYPSLLQSVPKFFSDASETVFAGTQRESREVNEHTLGDSHGTTRPSTIRQQALWAMIAALFCRAFMDFARTYFRFTNSLFYFATL
ncbi:hypothetical protein TRVL_00276 [Trypanosoma vivax]|nr:hypothetical protein TRVL_00276 [Trypanosoma vivax]